MLKIRRQSLDQPGWFSTAEALCDAPLPDVWSIYVVFTEAPGGMGLLKVGVSQDPRKRIVQVHQGSPLPIKAGLFCPVGGKKLAHNVESAIHAIFAQRRTRGEWFRFDYADPIDKQCFHQGTKGIYAALVRRPLQWSELSCAALMGADTGQKG